MKDVLRRGLLASIGLAAFTKEYVEHALNSVSTELSKRGYSEAEGKKIVVQLLKEGKSTKDHIVKMTEAKVDKMMKDIETAENTVKKKVKTFARKVQKKAALKKAAPKHRKSRR